jgi:hypothetical protein
LPIFLKLFTNLKSGDNNRANAPDFVLPTDILSLYEYETVDRVREPSNPDCILIQSGLLGSRTNLGLYPVTKTKICFLGRICNTEHKTSI